MSGVHDYTACHTSWFLEMPCISKFSWDSADLNNWYRYMYLIFFVISSIRQQAFCAFTIERIRSIRRSPLVKQDEWNLFPSRKFIEANSFASKFKLSRRRNNWRGQPSSNVQWLWCRELLWGKSRICRCARILCRISQLLQVPSTKSLHHPSCLAA